MKRAFTLFLFTFILVLSSLASADSASEAFNEGKRLMGKAKYAEACAQFAKAESAAGPNVKTRYWTGRCKEEQGNKATAFLAYKDAKRMAIKAGDAKRAKVIDQRISELGQILPFLVITVPKELEGVEGLTLTRNGEDVPKTLWGEPLPVDMGKHQITVSAPGYQEVTLNVTASEPGSKAQLVLPTLSKIQSDTPSPDPGVSPTPTPVPGAGGADEPEMERKNAGLFWTGVGLTAAGGLAVIGGLVFIALGAVDDVGDTGGDGECVDFDPDTFECLEYADDSGSSDRTPTGIGLAITGVVFLGVGIPFMVVFGKKVPAEPDEEEEKEAFTIEPVITPGGFKLRGTF